MAISLGEKAARRLETGLLKISNTIKVELWSPTTKCAGAFHPDSQEYDPKADRIYHAQNPSVALCVNGYVTTKTVKTIQGFHFQNLKDAPLDLKSMGEVPKGKAMFLTMRNQKILGIRKYRAPTTTDEWWLIEEGWPRTVAISDVGVFQLAIAVKE
jgi:hypothetical protein